jgi:hypothetical protein
MSKHMIVCSMRGVECGCEPTECRAAPPKHEAPISFTMRDQLVAVAYGAVVSAFVLVAMSAWNEQLKTAATIDQEQVSSWK